MSEISPPTQANDRGQSAPSDSDRGVALLEFALVLPFLTLLLLGVVEMGLGWKAATQADSATASASRTASSSAKQPTADLDALQVLYAGLSSEEQTNLQYVVIYKANSLADTPDLTQCVPPSPTAVAASGKSGYCNVYSGKMVGQAATFASSSTYFGCGGSAWDRFWCPTARSNSATSADGMSGIDYVGIYVVTKHNSLSHTYFADFTITRNSVFRLEPDYS